MFFHRRIHILQLWQIEIATCGRHIAHVVFSDIYHPPGHRVLHKQRAAIDSEMRAELMNRGFENLRDVQGPAHGL